MGQKGKVMATTREHWDIRAHKVQMGQKWRRIKKSRGRIGWKSSRRRSDLKTQ